MLRSFIRMHGYLIYYNKKLLTTTATVHLKFLHVGTMEGTTTQLPELLKLNKLSLYLGYLSIVRGVFLYCSRALHSLSPLKYLPFQAVRMIFFIDFTVASALPLLCG